MYMFVYMDMYMCLMNMCMGLYLYMDMDCYEDICGHRSPSSAQPGSFFTNISAPLSAGLYLLTVVSRSQLSLKLIIRVIISQKSVSFAKRRVIFLKKIIKCSSILLPSKVSPFLLRRH